MTHAIWSDDWLTADDRKVLARTEYTDETQSEYTEALARALQTQEEG